MEWIDAKTELPTGYLQKYYLKINWNVKIVGTIKTVGFWNNENKKFHTDNRGLFSKKYVQWLKEE